MCTETARKRRPLCVRLYDWSDSYLDSRFPLFQFRKNHWVHVKTFLCTEPFNGVHVPRESKTISRLGSFQFFFLSVFLSRIFVLLFFSHLLRLLFIFYRLQSLTLLYLISSVSTCIILPSSFVLCNAHLIQTYFYHEFAYTSTCSAC